MILFTWRFLALAFSGAVVLLAFGPSLLNPAVVLMGWNLVLVGVAVVDGLIAGKGLTASRRCQDHLSLGAANNIELVVSNASRVPWRVQIKDEPPVAFALKGSRKAEQRVPSSGTATVAYQVVPAARGNYVFGDIHLRAVGVLGLGMRQFKVAGTRNVRVYPNLIEMSDYDVLLQKGRLHEVGLKPARIIGSGTEFETLREYVPGDDFRRINWPATARRGKPMMNEYDTDRSQNIMLALDAGRMMTVNVGGLTKMDHAINSALMLGYVATLHGDRVGLLVFGDEVITYLPPGRGRTQLNRIIEALYQVKAAISEPDYYGALRFLAINSRKRSLVCIFTDVADEESSEALAKGVMALQPVHLPVCISVADPEIQQMVTNPIHESQDAYEKAVACEIVEDRVMVARRMRQMGVAYIDALPGQLTAAAINQYLEIKARKRL